MALEEGLPQDAAIGALPETGRNRFVLEHVARQVEAAVEAAAAAALESRERHMPDGSDVTDGVYAKPLPARES
jgi:hypothetical protein